MFTVRMGAAPALTAANMRRVRDLFTSNLHAYPLVLPPDAKIEFLLPRRFHLTR